MREEKTLFYFSNLYFHNWRYVKFNLYYLKSINLSVLHTKKTAMSIIIPSLTLKEHQKTLKELGAHCLSEKPEKNKNYYSFTFVRNPLERLVCCYKRKIVSSPKQENFNNIYLGGRLGDCKTFDEFVDIVLTIPDKLLEGHILINSDIIFDEQGKSRIDFIGKYENLYEDYKIIQNKFNLPDLRPTKTPNPNWQDCYTLKTAKAVAKKYWKDIEMFNYQKEYEELIKYLEEKERKKII